MMKKLFILVFICISATMSQTKIPLNLDSLFSGDKYKSHPIENVQWFPDGSAFSYTKENPNTGFMDIYKHDVSDGTDELLISDEDLLWHDKPIELSAYEWTDDGKYLLIQGPDTSIWRHSRKAPYYLYNLLTKKVTALANNDQYLSNVKLSPDGKYVGYVKDFNIYIQNLETGKAKAVTRNGSFNILNGEFDWVNEEEFGMADAWKWSPDGAKIAYWQFDQTRVKTFNLIDELDYYNTITPLKYPKVGEQNAIVNIAVYDVKKKKTTWMDLGDNDNIYIPNIYWTNSSSKLAILRLNREQNHLDILMASTRKGQTEIIIQDDDPCYVDITHDISFLKNRDEIVISSEKSGYRHAYLYNYKGELINQITKGDWEISKILGVDEKSDILYFSGKKETALEQTLYKINLDGTHFQKISSDAGWHKTLFSTNYEYYIDTWSNVKTPEKSELRRSNGDFVEELEAGSIEALNKHNMVYPEFLKIKTDDGKILNAYIIKPYDFNPDKKYPVLVFGYGGPGSQKVVNRWGKVGALWHNYMTEQGYIVFCIDNRGTGGRGKAFENLAYGDLSKWSVNDQIEGAKYLQSLDYVDPERLGFWGWSGGGYLTIALMTRATEYFKTGVAVAPVSDFKTYDTIWTERYLGQPDVNVEGYEKSDLTTTADSLKGHLLIIHGSGDDNVHYQNTIMFVNECIKLNKAVDMFIYPNKTHSIKGGNTRLHLYSKITDYFNTYLR